MKISSFFLIGTLLILQLSCRKIKYSEEVKKVKNTIENSIYGRDAGVLSWKSVIADIEANATAIYGFSATKTPFTNYSNGTFQGLFRTTFVDDAYGIKLRSNTISRDNYYNYTRYNNDVLTYFADTVTIEVNYRIGATTYQFTKNYALPAKLELIPGNNFDSKNAIVNDGTTIDWVEDASEVDSYIAIALDYNPKSLVNSSMTDTIQKMKTLLVADNGSYTFSGKDIEDFPDGGFVTVTISRFAIRVDTKPFTNHKFAFGSMSTIIMTGTISK